MGKAQFIDPRDEGHRPPRLAEPVFSEEALARAEQTLEALSSSLAQWLDTDVAKLQAARAAATRAAWSNQSLDSLWRVAHELKGMGSTYGYPIVTQLAASLCRLIETEAGKRAARAMPGLVDAHVDALRAAVRDRIASDAHPVGKALVQTLEAQVMRLGVAPR